LPPDCEAVHERVEKSVGLSVLFGFAGDGEDADEAGRDLLGSDVDAEYTCGATRVEDGGDRCEELVAGPGVGDRSGVDHGEQGVDHAVFGGQPMREEVHPTSQSTGTCTPSTGTGSRPVGSRGRGGEADRAVGAAGSLE